MSTPRSASEGLAAEGLAAEGPVAEGPVAQGPVAVFRLPDLGEGLADAEIVAWLVEVGAAIEEEQPFVRVSTAKAEVEIPCPYHGVVVACHGEPGDVLPVGAPVLEVALEASAPLPAGMAPAVPEGSRLAPPGEAPRRSAPGGWAPSTTEASRGSADWPVEPNGSGGAIGSGGANGSGEEVRGAPHPAFSPVVDRSSREGCPSEGSWQEGRPLPDGTAAGDARPAGSGEPQPEVALLVGYGSSLPSSGPTTQGRRRLRFPPPRTDRGRTASPVVRRLALEWGVDLSRLVGTGPGGLITRRDVEAAVGRASDLAGVAHRGPRSAEEAISVPTSAPSSAETPSEIAPAERSARSGRVGEEVAGEVDGLRGVRRVMAERMAASHREVAAAVAMLEAEATGLLRLRQRLATRHPETHVTTFAVLAGLAARSLERVPRLNAWATPAGLARRAQVDLGVAVQTERGLVVPVVRDAARLGIVALAERLADLAARARAGTLRPEELSGATFTVSNYGAFGVDAGVPMVDVPQVAILGVGRLKDRPVVRVGRVEAAATVWLSLAFDHRYLDGGDAGGFLRVLADVIDDPALLLEGGSSAPST